MLACVYQSRPLQSAPPQHHKKPKKPSTLVIDRVPGFALKMVTSAPPVTNLTARKCASSSCEEDGAEDRSESGGGGSDDSSDKCVVVVSEPTTTTGNVKRDDVSVVATASTDRSPTLKLRDGVELTLSELEEMACRQQQQIDSQRQLLAAKEQRLRFLKQHEARHQQVAAEHERLRRLRDRVEAQELKLRKLRALRGQVDQNKLNNASLTSDLDSIRALFNEKEKELSVAVAKVEELTRQLEELRRGRNGSARETTPSAAAQELDKLRRELMYRNKLNEQQNVRLNQQREALSQRQEEMTSIDKRISELQNRLHRKRLLNQQLANQITAASNKAASTQQQQQLRNALSASAIQHHQQQQPQMYQQSHSSVPNVGNKQLLRPVTSGNIAAIEPYHHVPSATSKNTPMTDTDDFQKQNILQSRQQHLLQTRNEMKNERVDAKDLYINRRPHISETGVQDQSVFNNERFQSTQDDFSMKMATSIHKNNNIMAMTTNQNYSPIDDSFKMKDDKCDVSEILPEFSASKSDPKYQTLPYNTKFTVNYMTQQPQTNSVKNINSQNRRPAGEGGENLIMDTIEGVKNNNNSVNHVNNNVGQQQQQQQQQQLMSVAHSIPILAGANKGLATPLANQNSKITSSISSPSSSSSSSSSYSVLGNLQPRVYGTSNIGMSLLTRGQPVGGTSSTTSSTSSLATNSSGSSSNHQIVVSPISCTTTSLLSSLPSTNTLSNTTTTTTTTTTSSSCMVLGKMFTLPPTPLSLEFQKPVSSVAPTSVQHPSPIYQTSSTKIHPVQPQTLSSTPQGIFRDQKGDTPSPPTSAGTPDSATSKPALPPKPALPVKPTPPPPPRQAHWAGTEPNVDATVGESSDIAKRGIRGTVDISSEAVDSALNVLRGAVMLSTRGGVTDYSSGVKPTTSSIVNLPPPPPPPTSEPPSEDTPPRRVTCEPVIKARPLTIRKPPPSEIPRLRSSGLTTTGNQESKTSTESGNKDENSDSAETTKPESDTNMVGELSAFGTSRRIEMPPAFLFPETEAPPADLVHTSEHLDQTDRAAAVGAEDVNLDEANKLAEDKSSEDDTDVVAKNVINKEQTEDTVVSRRVRKGNLKGGNNGNKQLISRRVSFDPLALLLDASLEGELELVVRTAGQVRDPSAANDEGITALHNAICAGHLDIVRFLVQFGCDVNAQDSDGWTPLHCAASCNNLAMVRFLVEHGACIFATTLSDHETAAEKCEEDEEGFDGCSEYLYSVQEKLGILNNGAVYAVFDYDAHNSDELSFREGDRLVVLRKGDEWEREWWWARLNDKEGYIPRNLLGLYPRVHANKNTTAE